MKFTNAIMRLFGKERAALYKVEVQHLVEKGYSKRDIDIFLETYALPIGIFDILSMFARSKLSVKDMEKSLSFLFDRHVILQEMLAKQLMPKCRILDFGCGRGLIACSLALKGFKVHGADISAEALEVANELAKKLSCEPVFHVIKEDELPFPDAYFDVVLCVWAFHEIPLGRMTKTSMELYRILRKMGDMFIVDQEDIAPFETIKNIMNQRGLRLVLEKKLSPVYDHGKASHALMLKFVKEK